MKKFFIIFLVVSLPQILRAQKKVEGFSWGCSKKEIYKTLGAPKGVEPNIIIYPYQNDTVEVMKGYMFYQDKLAGLSRIYKLKKNPETQNSHLFTYLSDSISKKFKDGEDIVLDNNGAMVRVWKQKNAAWMLYYRPTGIMLSIESKKLAPLLHQEMDRNTPEPIEE